jgi:hypothetical protein
MPSSTVVRASADSPLVRLVVTAAEAAETAVSTAVGVVSAGGSSGVGLAPGKARDVRGLGPTLAWLAGDCFPQAVRGQCALVDVFGLFGHAVDDAVDDVQPVQGEEQT